MDKFKFIKYRTDWAIGKNLPVYIMDRLNKLTMDQFIDFINRFNATVYRNNSDLLSENEEGRILTIINKVI